MNAVRDKPCPRCGGSTYSIIDGRSFCLSCAGERVFAAGLFARETPKLVAPSLAGDSMPQRIGDYEILEELGRGGMGRVYAARQIGLGRIVALKVIGGSARDAAELELRFLREAQTVARLRHANIVAVYDSGRVGDLLYFSMEYIDGGDLATRLKDRVYTPREATLLIARMADALAYAHGEGVLHRDVKPSNILLEGEEPRLADFGLAAQLESGGDLTARSGVLGTPHYLALEALRGGSAALTVASDIYALGVVLFEMLTGRTPFAGASLAELPSLLSEREPPSPRLLSPAVPRDLETICLKCLEREPSRRYASAADLRSDLHHFFRGEPIVARPITWPNRFVRWCRRKPALAAVWFLVTAIAIGSTAAMLRIRSERSRTERALSQTLVAEDAAKERLRDAKLAEARAIGRTTIPGRRQQALAAIAEAVRIRPGADLRDQAITALMLYDVKPIEKWDLALGGPFEINFDPKGTVATAEARNNLSVARPTANVYRWGEAKPFSKLAVPGTGAMGEMRFSHDGKLAMARYADQTLRVWRIGETQPALTISNRPLPGGERQTETFNADYDFTADGTCVVLGLPGRGLSLHRIADGAEIARWADGDLFHMIQVSPDGRYVAADNIDATANGAAVYVLTLPDLRVAHKLVTPSKPGALTWSSDSRVLAIGQRQSSFALYDIRDGRLLANVTGSVRDSPEIDFVGANDGLLTLRGKGTTLHVVNAVSGAEELSFTGAGPSQIATDRTTGNFIVPSLDTSVTRMHVETPVGFRVIPPPAPSGLEVLGNYYAIDFSPDARWIATANRNVVLLYDAETGRLAAELDTHIMDSNDTGSVAFSANGEAMYRCSTSSSFVRYPILRQPDGSVAFGNGEPLDAEAGFFIADGTRDWKQFALLNMASGDVKIVAPEPGKLRVVSRFNAHGAYNAAFNPDGTQLLVNTTGMGPQGSIDRIRVYSTADGSVVKELPAKVSCDTAWSADGRTAMTSNGATETTLWDTSDWHARAVLKGELGGDVTSFTIAPDSTYAVVTHDERVHLVSTSDASLLATFDCPGASGLSSGVRFLPDGKRFAVLWRDGRIDIVDPEALRAEVAKLGLGW